MGGCCSTEVIEADEESTRSSVRNPIRYTFCNRKKIILKNNSNVHASIAITAGPIRNVSSVSADSIGSIAFDRTGTDRVQKFKLLANRPRCVRIHSNYFYVTVYLHIKNEWKPLWVNREFYQLDNITIWEHHVAEASIDQMFAMLDDDADE